MKILSISVPGGDRGPAVGYRNHIHALASCDITIKELTQEIWNNPNEMKKFDVAWAYVRFHQEVYRRCMDLNIPIIGGPNIALERADAGITDDWERWYLTESKVKINVNVAEYYTNRVKSFVTSDLKCRTIEYCYESNDILNATRLKNPVDVLIYNKDRVNDGGASNRVSAICSALNREGISYRIVQYGYHSREDYIRECLGAKICAWLSIEDYCSLAQIEAHLAGCCVVGTPYNLTIPTFEELLVHEAQTIDSLNWISWMDNEKVAKCYVETIKHALSMDGVDNLSEHVRARAKLRHSYEYYRKAVQGLIQETI